MLPLNDCFIIARIQFANNIITIETIIIWFNKTLFASTNFPFFCIYSITSVLCCISTMMSSQIEI